MLSGLATAVYPQPLDQLPGLANVLPSAHPVLKLAFASSPDPFCPALRPRIMSGVLDSGVTRPLSHPPAACPSSRSDLPPTRISWKAPLTSYARSLARSCLACWLSGSVSLAFSPACGSAETNPSFPAYRYELSQGFPTHLPRCLRFGVRLLAFRLSFPRLFTSSRLGSRLPRLLVRPSSSTRVSSHQPLGSRIS